MKIFFALFPPLDNYGRFFADVFKKFDKQKRNLDFIPLDQIHLNLRFVGANVTESSYKKIIDLFKKFEGQYTKPEVKIKNIQFGFKHQSYPKYVVADVFQSQSLIDLSEEIHKLFKYLDLKDTIRWKEKHSKSYFIHIARKNKIKGSGVDKQLKEIANSINLKYPEPFIGQEITVIQGIANRKGQFYKKIDSIKI